MATNSTVKQVLQVSEDAAPPFHVPIMIGNEIIILTQQDIRRVEDIRCLTYNRLNTNGQLSPLTVPTVAAPCAPYTSPHVPLQMPQLTSAPPAQFCTLPDIIRHCQQRQHEHESKQHEHKLHWDDDMVPEEQVRTVASIRSQLRWAKQCQTSSPFALSYSIATSTSGLVLNNKANTSCQACNKPQMCCNGCQCESLHTNAAVNTEGKMLFKKKTNKCSKDWSKKRQSKKHGKSKSKRSQYTDTSDSGEGEVFHDNSSEGICRKRNRKYDNEEPIEVEPVETSAHTRSGFYMPSQKRASFREEHKPKGKRYAESDRGFFLTRASVRPNDNEEPNPNPNNKRRNFSITRMRNDDDEPEKRQTFFFKPNSNGERSWKKRRSFSITRRRSIDEEPEQKHSLFSKVNQVNGESPSRRRRSFSLTRSRFDDEESAETHASVDQASQSNGERYSHDESQSRNCGRCAHLQCDFPKEEQPLRSEQFDALADSCKDYGNPYYEMAAQCEQQRNKRTT